MSSLINVASECFCPLSRMVPASEASSLVGLLQATLELVWCATHACTVRVGYMVSLSYEGEYGETEHESKACASTRKSAARLRTRYAAQTRYPVEVVRVAMSARQYFTSHETMAENPAFEVALAAHEARLAAVREAAALAASEAAAREAAAPPAWGAALRAQVGL